MACDLGPRSYLGLSGFPSQLDEIFTLLLFVSAHVSKTVPLEIISPVAVLNVLSNAASSILYFLLVCFCFGGCTWQCSVFS